MEHTTTAAITPDAAPKTWGPFTGRQLTTMFCTLVVMLLFPVGAWAVAGSNSFVTDAATGKQASVNGAKQLQVGEAAPSAFYVHPKSVLAGGAAAAVATPPAGKALVIKEIALHSYSATGTIPYVSLYVASSNCAAISTNLGYTDLQAGAHVVLPINPGLAVPSGSALCAYGNGVSADVLVTGYTVASAAVGAPGPAIAPLPPRH